MGTIVLDGGDRSCGELLLVLHRRIRDLQPGDVIELIAHDPIAPIDLPVWCHLTGHRYLGPRPDRVDTYLVEVAVAPRAVREDRPWHLAPVPTPAAGVLPDHPRAQGDRSA